MPTPEDGTLSRAEARTKVGAMVERERVAGRQTDDEVARVPAPDEADASSRGDDAAKAAAEGAEHERHMEVARKVMRDHWNVLRALAR